ncbi:MAG: carboxymuconolactone decarboxylase family protein [Alistipes sp.]|nr:carboxymuconolactone decarboxylase family protein [Alistipes sp.]
MKIITILATLVTITTAIAQNPHTMNEKEHFQQPFPQGAENPPVNAQYFIGQSYLTQLTHDEALNCPVYNVTFEPGCRNNWHSHTGGQLLLVTAGRGYYQEQGCPARELLPGDVVEIAPDVVHWHGAAPDSWFAHLAVTCNPQTNRATWLGPVDDAQYAAATAEPASAARISPEAARNIAAWQAGEEWFRSDPELAEIFGNFAFDETQRYGDIDTKIRILTTMAAAVAMQSDAVFRMTLRAALSGGITPVEIRETLYQAVPYAGMGKVADFIGTMNAAFEAAGVRLPLDAQATTSPDDRLERGLALQRTMFGEQIDRMYAASPENQLHIQRALSGNCFGDYVSRGGLDIRMRELLTFSILAAQGGCENQLRGHIRGNLAAGSDKRTLLAVITQLLPYIGYPRTLNAIACINEVIPEND